MHKALAICLLYRSSHFMMKLHKAIFIKGKSSTGIQRHKKLIQLTMSACMNSPSCDHCRGTFPIIFFVDQCKYFFFQFSEECQHEFPILQSLQRNFYNNFFLLTSVNIFFFFFNSMNNVSMNSPILQSLQRNFSNIFFFVVQCKYFFF